MIVGDTSVSVRGGEGEGERIGSSAMREVAGLSTGCDERVIGRGECGPDGARECECVVQ